ncbi:hypothetical protein ACFWAP_03785 [Streptomyces goshikiensis]|uniref:hypothetical protein n=1 Tax=Streptomyces goshikiensis TaxID=1942 RepID=UPI0036484F1E
MDHDATPQMPPPLVTPPQTPQPSRKTSVPPVTEPARPSISSVCRKAIQANATVTETELLVLVLEAGHEETPRLADTVRRTAQRIDPTRRTRATAAESAVAAAETAAEVVADPAGEAAMDDLSDKWTRAGRWADGFADLIVSLGAGAGAALLFWLAFVETGLAEALRFPEAGLGLVTLLFSFWAAWTTAGRRASRRMRRR